MALTVRATMGAFEPIAADWQQIIVFISIASMALGAQGVWCGSVWLTTEEAETHPVVKEKFLAATSADTVRSRSSTGKPARQLRSALGDSAEEPRYIETVRKRGYQDTIVERVPVARARGGCSG